MSASSSLARHDEQRARVMATLKRCGDDMRLCGDASRPRLLRSPYDASTVEMMMIVSSCPW